MYELKQLVPNSIKEPAKEVKERLISRFHALPHFIVIGAMKSGTSSLLNYLSQHPQILPSSRKEVHFFDSNFDKKEYWYRLHFPLKKELVQGLITGEASPSYIFNPHVAERIYNLLPNVKLIAILRNPIERAISHYFHEIRLKRETLPIMEALQAEEQRIHSDWESMIQNKEFCGWSCIHFSYKKRGIYIEQLERYWQNFSKEQLLIIGSERFFAEPQKTLRKVFNFIEVDAEFEVKDLTPKNAGIQRSNVPATVYEYLEDFFSQYNQNLYQRLGQDFGW